MLSTCGCAGISHLVATPDAEGGGVSYDVVRPLSSDMSMASS